MPPLLRDARDVAITWAVLALVLVACLGTLFFDLRTPDAYAADGLSHDFLVKTILETGWFSRSQSVGAPFGSDFLDYPFADGLHFVTIRIIGFFAGDWVSTANLFFIAGFFLSAGSACIVFRRLGLASPWAIAGGVLFALLPYHLFRRRHLLLASYFAVPIGVYLACVAANALPRNDGSRARAWILGGLAIVVGSTGIYYAFFSTFLVAVGGVIAMLIARRIAAGRVALCLVLAIAVTVLVNAAPNIAFRLANGPNPEAVFRDPSESEIYGLRITQMILPHPDHRIRSAGDLAGRYAASAPSVNENQFAALGLIGSVGLVLMAVVGRRPRRWRIDRAAERAPAECFGARGFAAWNHGRRGRLARIYDRAGYPPPTTGSAS
jgi:phosphoglycerol transferase